MRDTANRIAGTFVEAVTVTAWNITNTRRELAAEIDTAIAAAVQAEREACEKIAENRSSGITQAEIHATTRIAKQIAAAIRARKDVTK